MSSLKDARTAFYSALEGLKEVRTRDELETQSEKVNGAKKRLLEIDSEFKAMIEERRREAKIRADITRAEYKSRMAESKAKASQVIARAKLARMEAEGGLDNFVAEYRVKTRTLEEAEKGINDKLVCPICHGPNRGNTMNGTPICFKCMHKLVPKSELKDYNRAYRRRWKRR